MPSSIFQRSVRNVAAPILTDLGFERSASTFRKLGTAGNVAVVSFRRLSGATGRVCQLRVGAGLVLGPDVDLNPALDGLTPNKATDQDATLQLEVNAPSDDIWSTTLVDAAKARLGQLLASPADELPPGLAGGPRANKDQMIANGLSGLDSLGHIPPPWWTIVDDETAEIAHEILRIRLSALAPYLSDLLDLGFFLQQTHRPGFPDAFPIDGVRYVGTQSVEYLRMLITADHDPDDEFSELVRAWETDTNWTIAAFLGARHAQRQQ